MGGIGHNRGPRCSFWGNVELHRHPGGGFQGAELSSEPGTCGTTRFWHGCMGRWNAPKRGAQCPCPGRGSVVPWREQGALGGMLHRVGPLLPSHSISAKRWLCHPESCSCHLCCGAGCSVCPCLGGGRAGYGPRHTGEGGGGAGDMLFMLSHPLEEACGGRSKASSRIAVVMVNFCPGAGKLRHFPKISQALC